MHSILIVEDDIALRDALSDVLELAGYPTRCAQNGREALDLLRTPPWPAIILLDLNLPVSACSCNEWHQHRAAAGRCGVSAEADKRARFAEGD